MESGERSRSSLRRGASCSRIGGSTRLASSSFANRQRQQLEGTPIVGGDSELRPSHSFNEHEVGAFGFRNRSRNQPVNFDRTVDGNSGVVEESPRTVELGKKLKQLDNSEVAQEKIIAAKEVEQWYNENYKEGNEYDDVENEVNDCQRNSDSSAAERPASGLKRGSSIGVLIRSGLAHKAKQAAGSNENLRPRSKDRILVKSPRFVKSPSERPESHQPGGRQSVLSPRQNALSPRNKQFSSSKSKESNHLKLVVPEKDPEGYNDSDTSLKLSLKGLNDSDDDSYESAEEYNETIKHTEVHSPRKSAGYVSPRKGVMSATKTFEAKNTLIQRRDSDTSLVKRRQLIDRPASSACNRPVVKTNLQLKTFSNESLNDDKKILVKRTSSGRKLPIPNVRNTGLKKSDSESSFLSISKDGSTEYVSLDLSNAFVNFQNPETEVFEKREETVVNEIPVSPTEENKEFKGKAKTMADNTSRRADRKSGIPAAAETNGTRGSQSADRGGKPPLEKKPSRGVIQPSPRGSGSGGSSSPRKIVAASPRTNASPRVSASARTQSSPRTAGARAPSPRGATPVQGSRGSPRDSGARPTTPRATTPRATTPRSMMLATERRSSRENLHSKNVDQVDSKRPAHKTNSDSAILAQNGTHSDASTGRRQRSSSGGNIMSPRPGSPVKGRHLLHHGSEGALHTKTIIEEPVVPQARYTRQESCTQMDLQQVIALFMVGKEEPASEGSQARSETEVQSEKTWMDAERVWLVHKGGFAAASQMRGGDGYGLPEGRVKIRLDHGGEILEVDEDDVEKANPPQLDRAEDLSLLRFLNESSGLHSIRQRYGGNLIHTYAGPSLIILNPMQPLQIYSDKVIQMFKGCKQEDMPPHIFATAQIAYRDMLNTRQDQSVVLMGRSGSGKTYNALHLLHYLAATAGTVGGVLTVEKLNAVSLLLEAFGNSRTILNTSASRFSQMTTLDFDHNGQVVSASVQVLMFEKTRVVRRPEGEPTFHVFYQLLAGVDAKLRSELQLNSLADPNLFMTPLQKAEDKQRAMQYWAKIYTAMATMGMTDDEVKSICSVLAAIYHLGVAGASKGANNKGQFSRPAGAQRAASLLGISVEELARLIFSSSGSATLTRTNAARSTSSPADKSAEAHTTAMEALEGFVIGLYSDVFNAIVSLINRSLSSNYRTMSSITVVDTPGFQNPSTCGRQSGASFEDLCHNYMQEKLQLLFHELVFTIPQDRYCQENVECDFEFVTSSPAAMVSLIEKPSQQSLNTGSSVSPKPRPSSYHENRDTLSISESQNHEGHTKGQTKGQGHTNHEVQRSHSTSSVQGFSSKIPVKVTSTLKSYQHLCANIGSHGNHQGHGDLDEVRTSTPEVREAEKKGLLWILDEEAIFPGATEDSFMDRFFSYHGEQKVKRDSLLRKASSLGNTFILNHFQGTNPVQYNASGWLKVCRENPITKVATQVLQDSKKANIKELFNSVKAPVGGMVSGSIVGMEGSNTLRRVGSMRRTFMSGTAGLKKRSMCLLVKFQVDTIIETVRKTKCHFVHCLLPQANAGLCELRNPADMAPERPDDILMNVPLVRAQFRGNEILESVRIHRQGFPDHITFGEFIQKFEGLVPPNVKPTPDMGEKPSVIQIIENLDIDKLNYRIGLSKVFFRSGAINRLESSRDDRVTGRITSFQAYCRGYVARKRLEKLRVQHVAISCIQKNVRKFYQIRDWDWWKLYVKVKPLLNVHRTEEELRDRELELEQLKTKLDRIEKERNDYKMTVDKLENRVVELTADLSEENTTATQASEMLESESAERMRLEKELKDVQSRYNALKRNHDKIEMEMTQVRLWQAETLEDHLDEDDVDGGIYKERYERLRKESTFSRKKMQQQHEEELEQEHASKKNMEKRLHEAQEDSEDLRRQLAAAKRKAQKLTSEMQDSKLHLEEQMARNNDLERKQRKHDTEQHKALEEAKAEKSLREKIQREKDTLAADKFSLEKQVQRLKGDVESGETKYDRLQKELSDTLTSAGTKDDQGLSALKRAKTELESKVLDQEEELDDQAGQIQQLEQTKVRLEMNLEKSRQQHMKEIEEKEQEMEDLRYSTQKKLKQMEGQMEEEYEERKLQNQKVRDLEQKIQDLQGHASFRDKDTEKRLRSALRKTRALLKDAEIVLQKQKTGEASKMQVRQLRNQLEDLEFSSASAMKAKKTMELEVADLQQQLDELMKSKQESENRAMALLREKTDTQSQLEENEEDLADVMKKYKAVVQQQTVDQITMNDQLAQIEELVAERDKLKSEVNDLKARVQSFEENSADKTVVKRLENKIRDLEARLDLETANKHRIEVQLNRTKEQLERAAEEKEVLTTSRSQAEENIKRVQRQLRDLREEFSDVQKREMEMASKYKENENRVSELESDFEQNQSDLKLAFKRISDLQAALEEGLESDDDFSDSELDDADSGSDIDASFVSNHSRSPLSGRRRSLDSSETRSRLTSASSYLTDTPSSPRMLNNVDHSEI